MKKILLGLLLSAPIAGALAVDYDLQTCMFNNGLPMHPQSCESLRKRAAEQSLEQEKNKRRAAENRAIADKNREAAEAAQAIERARQDEERAAHKRKEAERIATFHREQDERDREYAAEIKAAEASEAKKKAACGTDYRNLQIGMQITRAQQCVASFKMTSQINRADGVISTYQSGRLYAHVMDGKIVSWGK
jgi:membrane protein involved in colicin uptake